jgi:hypothetical protein
MLFFFDTVNLGIEESYEQVEQQNLQAVTMQ